MVVKLDRIGLVILKLPMFVVDWGNAQLAGVAAR